jgi:sugar phosphate isomerase/epimerase
MQIRYAVSTMVFWGREHHLSFEQECDFLRSLGFGIELWPTIKGHDECRYEKSNWQRLIEATGGMLVSMRSRDDNPDLEQWQEQIECAKLLGANIVTSLHSLGIRNGSEIEDWDFASEIVRTAEDNKVKLCVETGGLEIVKWLGENFNSLLYCLDTGYANLDAKFGFKRYVDDLAEKVVHLHLADNYGHRDDHEPPGARGGISRKNWEYLLGALSKYDNNVVGSFEMSPCTPDVMINQASKFLFDVLKWPNRPKKQPASTGTVYHPA